MDIDTSPLLLEYIRKGEIKGEARGAAAMRRALQKTLEQSAGGSVPEDVRQRVEAQEDLTTLSDWCAGAFRCTTWDKARELIGAP
jgi:hypothetical protein